MGVKFEIENVVAVGSTVENPNIADTTIERQEPYVRSTIDEENATIHTNIVAPARLGGYVNSVNGKTGDVVLTPEDLGINPDEKVDKRLSSYAVFENTKENRLKSAVYVDNNGTPTKMRVSDIKAMNTKILASESHKNIDFDLLDKDDYILLGE